ncbi:hypothetical protein ES703_50630 [subsurface metagenome]
MPHIGYFPIGQYPRPLVLGSAAFIKRETSFDHRQDWSQLRNDALLTEQIFYAQVVLPQRARVTKLTLIGFRNDALAVMSLKLGGWDRWLGQITLAEVIADWTDGDSSGYDDTIDNPVIDNLSYWYFLEATLDPNDDTFDVALQRVQIDWS